MSQLFIYSSRQRVWSRQNLQVSPKNLLSYHVVSAGITTFYPRLVCPDWKLALDDDLFWKSRVVADFGIAKLSVPSGSISRRETVHGKIAARHCCRLKGLLRTSNSLRYRAEVRLPAVIPFLRRKKGEEKRSWCVNGRKLSEVIISLLGRNGKVEEYLRQRGRYML